MSHHQVRHRPFTCDQGDVGIAGELGAVVVPAGEGLVAASPGQPLRGMAGRSGPVQQCDNPATEDCGDYANQKRITARCVNAKAALA